MKTIKARHDYIKKIIKTKNINQDILKKMYLDYYTCSYGDVKINLNIYPDAYFTIEQNEKWYNSTCLWLNIPSIKYKDDISGKYLAGNKRTFDTDLSKAMDLAIQYQLDIWAEENGGRNGMHVDHIYPRDRIKKSFLNSLNYSINHFIIKDHIITNDDKKFVKKWQEYHLSVAEFEFKTPEENMRKSNKVNNILLL